MNYTITSIRQNGGLVAGQKKTLKLNYLGGVMTITDEKEILMIERWINEAAKWANGNIEEIYNYLEFMMDQEGLW